MRRIPSDVRCSNIFITEHLQRALMFRHVYGAILLSDQIVAWILAWKELTWLGLAGSAQLHPQHRDFSPGLTQLSGIKSFLSTLCKGRCSKGLLWLQFGVRCFASRSRGKHELKRKTPSFYCFFFFFPFLNLSFESNFFIFSFQISVCSQIVGFVFLAAC